MFIPFTLQPVDQHARDYDDARGQQLIAGLDVHQGPKHDRAPRMAPPIEPLPPIEAPPMAEAEKNGLGRAKPRHSNRGFPGP
jgi:hypothetical protein